MFTGCLNASQDEGILEEELKFPLYQDGFLPRLHLSIPNSKVKRTPSFANSNGERVSAIPRQLIGKDVLRWQQRISTFYLWKR